MDVVEVRPGLLYLFRFPVGQAYLWRDVDSVTLIDAGPPGQAGAITSAFAELGLSLSDLRQIILTHFHEDHVGSAADLAARSGARVLAHRVDAPVIRGDMPGPAPDFTPDEKALHEQIMAAASLLQSNPSPSDADIDAALAGNICRCGTYSRIRKAIHRAADLLPPDLAS